jgi:hypothetical protein
MEPATLRFERRVCKVKRVTSGKLLGPWPGSQRAATIHSSFDNLGRQNASALFGHFVPQGAFAVSGDL